MAPYNSPNRLKELDERARIRKENKTKTRQLRAIKNFRMSPSVRRQAIAKAKLTNFFRVKVLSEKQHKAIALLSDFNQCWGPEYICGQVGINLATLYNWRNDPFFIKELDKEITRRRTMFRLEAHRQLFRQIKKGKPRLLLAYLKMTGDFKEQIEVTDKTTDDLDETQLDEEIQRLQDELGITTEK